MTDENESQLVTVILECPNGKCTSVEVLVSDTNLEFLHSLVREIEENAGKNDPRMIIE
jgi:hypothetical protein